MLQVVFDANVFVSSMLVKAGLPAQVLNAWRDQQYLLVTSPAIVAEVRATLNYPRIRRKYAVSDQDVEELIALLERDALPVPDSAQADGAVPQDPSDEMVLACAVAAQADFIVGGDRHLLDMDAYCSIPILTVRRFWERLSEAHAASDIE